MADEIKANVMNVNVANARAMNLVEAPVVRASQPYGGLVSDLGLLRDLPGRWMGKGFNLIARPARQGVPSNPVFFLELNGTHETLEFTALGGDIPNRGSIEPTALLHAVHYLQTVSDCFDIQSRRLHPSARRWRFSLQTEC